MFCSNCDYNKELKGKRIVYKYDESGLENITLDGVIEYRCPECGEVYHNFGDLDQLHGLIANTLLTQDSPLLGNEIRFLRTYIGYSSAYFAKVLGIERETLSRLENGTKPAAKSLDRHIRAAVFNKKPDRDYDLHDAILNHPTHKEKHITFKAKKESWLPSFPLSPLVPSHA